MRTSSAVKKKVEKLLREDPIYKAAGQVLVSARELFLFASNTLSEYMEKNGEKDVNGILSHLLQKSNAVNITPDKAKIYQRLTKCILPVLMDFNNLKRPDKENKTRRKIIQQAVLKRASPVYIGLPLYSDLYNQSQRGKIIQVYGKKDLIIKLGRLCVQRGSQSFATHTNNLQKLLVYSPEKKWISRSKAYQLTNSFDQLIRKLKGNDLIAVIGTLSKSQLKILIDKLESKDTLLWFCSGVIKLKKADKMVIKAEKGNVFVNNQKTDLKVRDLK